MSPELKAAIDQWMAAAEQRGTRAGASQLSRHYRDGGRSDATVDPAAYLTVRLPATLAAVGAVLAEVRRIRPQFEPRSLLDAGSGPGTASWAAVHAWPSIAAVTMIDASHRFRQLAGELARHSRSAALSRAVIVAGDLEQLAATGLADLAIASYALAEIPLARVAGVAAALWRASGDMLVLVEPGTPAGFQRLRIARTALLAAGAVPVAPCPHGGACPMVAPDWCHFAVRLARSRAHMHAKSATVPYEDEKYTYLAVSRTGPTAGAARILTPPVDRKPGLTFRLCTGAGLATRHVARRDRDAYKHARKRGWGETL